MSAEGCMLDTEFGKLKLKNLQIQEVKRQTRYRIDI